MARGARLKPKRLAQKLVQLRTALGLSQNELIRELQVELTQNRIQNTKRIRESRPYPFCYATRASRAYVLKC